MKIINHKLMRTISRDFITVTDGQITWQYKVAWHQGKPYIFN
ncbi:hypothetical protein [Caudoviricetes sp.]|nr:hypothetical protein [Caudoviricetes sp.]